MQQLLENAFRHASEAIMIIDPYADCIVEANLAASSLLGYTHEELLGTRASALHPHELAALITFTESVLTRGKGWTDELSCRNKQGRNVPAEYSASRIDQHGRTYVIVTLNNRKQKKQLRERSEADAYVRRGISEWKRIERIFQDIERENQLMLRAVGDGIYGVNASGETTFLNPAAERMLGWQADDLVGKQIHSIIHHTRHDGAHYPSKECPIYAAFADGEVHHVDNEVFWRRDGSSFPVEYTSTPIEDHGRLVGAVVIFRDISDRREAEATLHAALAEVQELKKRLELENAYLQEELRTEHNYKEIVGGSVAVQQVIKQIELVAPTDANVLIYGESGTGKELIARAIHNDSARRERPLIRVNCAAIPRELFESEFFGHVKGAFSGAVQERAGRFELADGGTLFLDEVGEIPIELQGKLLRVLQEGQFERVGENRTRDTDVRVIAATNRDLKQAIREGEFREDLFYRLNVFPIESAPLRDRLEDVPLLASHFLHHACHKFNKPGVRMSRGDIQRLQAYHWPGNIRELQNVIERAVIVSRNQRLVLNLPDAKEQAKGRLLTRAAATEPNTDTILSREEMRQRERDNIVRALRQCRGRIFGEGGAAELLGVKPTTLASRVKRLEIDKRQFA